ncbi:hypothetical protein [Nocardia otitidiscaviarum]|uniref:hypothetical protein n=1 Tax=Nocardia otitidiscaviarum TaxID=1823 RepID=UPI0004A7682F|nr:hypothetical protein [Nocardia otitidiscaviarum]
MAGREQREALADTLTRVPTSCPAAVQTWVERGFHDDVSAEGEDFRNPVPDTSSGAACALEAAGHKHGCCWCGKFRTGLEVTDGRA